VNWHCWVVPFCNDRMRCRVALAAER
jgi:hypothetical protein